MTLSKAQVLSNRLDRLIRFFEYQKVMGVKEISLSGPAILAPGSYSPTEEEMDPLDALRDEVLSCTKCGLCEGRTQAVFGVGDENARLMFVGEGPGQEEDRKGEPFVGRAGQLLTKMIEAMNLSREEVYIANVIKCRPPNNRDPEADEIFSCEPYLIRQIELIQPEFICALGSHAAKTLLKTKMGISKLRGRFHSYHGFKLLPTFHPAYLLRNPSAKKDAWEDLKLLMREYGTR